MLAVLQSGGAPAAPGRRLQPVRRPAPARSPVRPSRVQAPISALAAGAPVFLPNFRVSPGASRAAVADNGATEFGDYNGLAFQGGKFYPAWADNSVTLAGNPDLPASRTLEIAAAAVTVDGDGAEPGAVANVSALTDSQWGPSVAINPADPANVVIVANAEAGGILKSYTLDGGTNWVTSVIADGTDSLDEAAADPSVAFDSYGNCFLAYMTDSNGGFFTCGLALSTDGGASFARRNPVGSADLDQPTVTTGPGPNGNSSVWVVYYDYTAANEFGGIATAGAPVTGLGTIGTFTRQTAPESWFGISPDIAIGPNGQVMVAFQEADAPEGPSPIVAHVDPNGLGTGGFGEGVSVGSTGVGWLDTIPASTGRKIGVEVGLAWDRSGGPANGRAYLIYTEEQSAESNDTSIRLRYSDNTGGTWTAPIRLDDDAGTRSQFMPRIAVDQTTGNVAACWYDCRADAGGASGTDTDGVANTEVELWATVYLVPVPQTIQFTAASYTVAENVGAAGFPVTRSGSTTAPASATYTATIGTADAGDFTAVSGTVAFGVGESAAVIQVPILPDTLLEPGETFTLTLTGPTGGATLGSPASANVTIADDPVPTTPTGLAAAPTAANTIRLTWTDNCSNEDGFEVWRRVGAGAFQPVWITGAGATEAFDATVTPDNVYTYRLRAVLGELASGFSNDASASVNVVSLSSATYSVSEAAGTVNVTVTRQGDTAGAASVSIGATPGTATTPADFSMGSTTLEFMAGEVSKPVAVGIVADTLLEGPEAFTVTLSNSSAGLFIGLGAATVTIGDDTAIVAPGTLTATAVSPTSIRLDWQDRSTNEEHFVVERRLTGGSFAPLDTAPAGVSTYTDTALTAGTRYEYRVRAVNQALASDYSGIAGATITTIQFSTAGAVTVEGNVVTITVTRTGDTTIPASASFATADGSATSPSDYTTNSGTIDFAAGDVSEQVTIPTQTDVALEGTEQFQVILTSPTGTGVVLGTQSTFTVTLSDEVVLLPPTGLTAQVGGPASITLSWTPAGAFATEFAVERRAGTAGAFVPLGATATGATTYRDDTAAVGITYAYRVRSTSGGGQSDPSQEASATIAAGAKATITPKKLNFATVKLTGPVKKKSFKIKNTGKVPLYGTVGAPTGPYRLAAGGGSFTLLPKKSLTVTVELVPVATGTATGGVLVTTSAARTLSVTVGLTGKVR